MIGSTLKFGMVLGCAASLMTAAALPAKAGDGGAIAAGIIGGTALGVLAGAAIASPPPPPPYYYYPPPPPPPAYYGPAAAGPYADPPRRRCARWRSRPDRHGNPVCLHYFKYR